MIWVSLSTFINEETEAQGPQGHTSGGVLLEIHLSDFKVKNFPQWAMLWPECLCLPQFMFGILMPMVTVSEGRALGM